MTRSISSQSAIVFVNLRFTIYDSRAMALVELLFAYVVLGLLLVLMVGVGNYVQREAKERLAMDMVLTLRDALQVYHAETGLYPIDDFSSDPKSKFENPKWSEDSESAEPIIAALLNHPSSAVVLRSWSTQLDHEPRVASYKLRATSHESRAAVFFDPWGRMWKYRTDKAADPQHWERVRIDGGVPFFESAGPDGKFGEANPLDAEDNIASDTTMTFR